MCWRRGQDIVPVPGTRRVKDLDDNLGAVNVRRTAGDLAQIDTMSRAGAAAGASYHAQAMQVIEPRRCFVAWRTA